MERRRRRLGGTILLVVAAAAAAVLIPAGAAAPATKPYTANICDSGQLAAGKCPEPSAQPTLPGGSTVAYLTIHNTANPQSLGSANIALPSGPTPTTYTAAAITLGSGDVTSTSNLVTLRNLNLAPGGSVTVMLSMSTPPCTGGTYDWSGAGILRVKQSNDFNGPPGNDFTRVGPSTLKATLAGGGCHLAVVSGHQPQDTIKTQSITDALYSSGGAVQVGLYDSGDNLVAINGTCPAGPGCVTANFGGGDSTAKLTGTKLQPLAGGIASFSGLSLDKSSNDLYRLTFASPGVTGATSDDFAITDTGTLCNPGSNPCSLASTFTGNGSTTTSDVSTTFSTTGGLSLTFFTGGLPAAVVASGGGCANFVPTSSPGVTLGIHGTTGTATIDYGISDKALKQRYGPNYGQPTVPICIGAMRLTNAGVKIPCESDSGGGWTGKALGSDGRLNGQFKTAVCDPTTHLWWSVAPTFQDNQNPSGFAPLSIEITQWGGQTAPDGTNLRLFTITKPNPWDYSMRG